MALFNHNQTEKSFTQKVWIVGLIFALIICLVLIFIASVHVFILILVGALVACYFRGLGGFISEKTGWSIRIGLLSSFFGTLLLAAGLFYLAGSTAVSQFSEFQESLPELIEKAEGFLNHTAVGQKFTSFAGSFVDSDKLGRMVSDFFLSTFGIIGNIFVIIIVGAYFTVSPKVYRNGLIKLAPPAKRGKAEQLIDRIANGLTKWLLGKFLAMGIIFVFTSIALAIIGLPFWLVLSVIAGLLVFIPNFGPVASAIPAILVALSVSLNMAIIVTIIYIVIQVSEGSIITPNVQNRLVSIPPALIILAQIFAAILIGVWGLIFATPIVYIIMVLVQELYIKPMEEKSKILSEQNSPE